MFQPHLPVRLPCYDLAPITSFTLGRSSRLRTSGTPGFHGLTGGALALAVADEVWMMENSVYSAISPEGCASILWKDSSKAPQAAEALKLTAQDLFDLHVIERIIREPRAEDAAMFESLKLLIQRTFEKNLALTDEELTNARYERFRRIGANL